MIGTTTTKTYEIFKVDHDEVSMSCTQVFDWFDRFKNGGKLVTLARKHRESGRKYSCGLDMLANFNRF